MAEVDCFSILQVLYDATGSNDYSALCVVKNDPLSLRCVAIDLLAWLKSMHSANCFVPFDVDVDEEVGADTRALVLGVPALRQTFAFDGRQIMFRGEVPDAAKYELCRKADNFYKPVVMRQPNFPNWEAHKGGATHL